MQKLSNTVYFFSWVLLVMALYAFLCLFNDSMDLDYFGIGRSRLLNNIIPKWVVPIVIILGTVWLSSVTKHFKDFASTSKFSKPAPDLPFILWWIPVMNFFAPVVSLNEIINHAGNAKTPAKEIKRMKSGSNWLKWSFILFHTLTVLGFCFYYFYETNKDGHDFFLNMLFLFLIFLSIGMLRLSSVLRQ